MTCDIGSSRYGLSGQSARDTFSKEQCSRLSKLQHHQILVTSFLPRKQEVTAQVNVTEKERQIRSRSTEECKLEITSSTQVYELLLYSSYLIGGIGSVVTAFVEIFTKIT